MDKSLTDLKRAAEEAIQDHYFAFLEYRKTHDKLQLHQNRYYNACLIANGEQDWTQLTPYEMKDHQLSLVLARTLSTCFVLETTQLVVLGNEDTQRLVDRARRAQVAEYYCHDCRRTLNCKHTVIELQKGAYTYKKVSEPHPVETLINNNNTNMTPYKTISPSSPLPSSPLQPLTLQPLPHPTTPVPSHHHQTPPPPPPPPPPPAPYVPEMRPRPFEQGVYGDDDFEHEETRPPPLPSMIAAANRVQQQQRQSNHPYYLHTGPHYQQYNAQSGGGSGILYNNNHHQPNQPNQPNGVEPLSSETNPNDMVEHKVSGHDNPYHDKKTHDNHSHDNKNHKGKLPYRSIVQVTSGYHEQYLEKRMSSPPGGRQRFSNPHRNYQQKHQEK